MVFPTETVYGLGGNGLSATSSKKIYAAKGRPSNNPLIIHVDTPHEAEKYAFAGDLYRRLAAAFMPGDAVVHLTFGRGVILSATPMGSDTLYEVMFDTVGTKRLMLKFAAAQMTKL